MEKYGKTANFFLGAYGQIGEIPHGRLQLDWGIYTFPIGVAPSPTRNIEGRGLSIVSNGKKPCMNQVHILLT